MALGLIVSLAASPWLQRSTGKTAGGVFAQPLCQWYALGLGLGLLSLTLGGVWLGILVPFVLWSLGLAGIVPVRPLSSSTAAALTVLVVFGAGAVHAIVNLLA